MVRRILLLCLTLLCGSAYGQTCTTTLNAGAAVGTAITNAAAGDVICLNNGNYSGFVLNNVAKTPRVTIRAVNSLQATFTGEITFQGTSEGMTFDGINYTGIYIEGANPKNFTFRNGDASADRIEIYLNTVVSPNILFENLTHYDQDPGGFCSGTTVNCLSIGPAAYWFNSGGRNGNPVATIRGAIISRGCADGIQTNTPFIFEYSVIESRNSDDCTPNTNHSDAIQMYGGNWEGGATMFAGTIIRYNHFYDSDTGVVCYDAGCGGILIEHNVFDAGSFFPRDCQIELYSDNGSIARNNTMIISGVLGKICYGKKPGYDDGVNTEIYNNITHSIALNDTTAAVNTKNLIPTGGGTNITGTATFEGTCAGAYTNWRNCALANGSAGKGAGTDGKDVGTRFYGVRKPGGLN